LRRAVAAGVLGLVVLGAALAAVLLQRGPRVAYDNARLLDAGVALHPGEDACQPREVVPPGAARLRLWVATGGKPGGPLGVAIGRGAGSARASTPGSLTDGPVDVALAPSPRPADATPICVRNAGRSDISLMGSTVPPGSQPAGKVPTDPQSNASPATVNGVVYGVPVRMRMQWRRAHDQTWLAVAPDIAQRSSLLKPSFFGAWTFWLAIGGAVLALLGAVALVVRQANPAGEASA
jgi:hypothetical protein